MSIFKYNIEIKKNAYLNWRTQRNNNAHNLATLANGYFLAAKILIDECLEHNFDKKADVVIFPILHSVIHGTEIYLKSIYTILAIWLEKDITHIGGHNIKQLYQIVIKIISEFEDKHGNHEDIKEIKSQLNVVKVFVDEIFEKTKDMDFVRYPIGRDKENHFYVDQLDNVVIDLEAFRCLIDELHDVLNRFSMYYRYNYEDYLEILSQS
ncbi:hypothetical protein GL288_13325, partial [Turicibacter sanguinis]|nr:hypothetical protein [Turicibacter sanguinis]